MVMDACSVSSETTECGLSGYCFSGLVSESYLACFKSLVLTQDLCMGSGPLTDILLHSRVFCLFLFLIVGD